MLGDDRKLKIHTTDTSWLMISKAAKRSDTTAFTVFVRVYWSVSHWCQTVELHGWTKVRSVNTSANETKNTSLPIKSSLFILFYKKKTHFFMCWEKKRRQKLHITASWQLQVLLRNVDGNDKALKKSIKKSTFTTASADSFFSHSAVLFQWRFTSINRNLALWQ